jgi:murein DD-endopeptidase MepM/ murein hydrolase activator NlpD
MQPRPQARPVQPQQSIQPAAVRAATGNSTVARTARAAAAPAAQQTPRPAVAKPAPAAAPPVVEARSATATPPRAQPAPARRVKKAAPVQRRPAAPTQPQRVPKPASRRTPARRAAAARPARRGLSALEKTVYGGLVASVALLAGTWHWAVNAPLPNQLADAATVTSLVTADRTTTLRENVSLATAVPTRDVLASPRLDIPNLTDADIARFVRPVSGAVTSDWHEMRVRGGVEQHHGGWDMDGRMGDPLVSPVRGCVDRVGYLGAVGKSVDIRLNNFVVNPDGTCTPIESDTDTYIARLGHMNAYAAGIQSGRMVVAGQRIGDVGNSGNSYSTSGGDGSHVHYEIRRMNGRILAEANRDNSDSVYFDLNRSPYEQFRITPPPVAPARPETLVAENRAGTALSLVPTS